MILHADFGDQIFHFRSKKFFKNSSQEKKSKNAKRKKKFFSNSLNFGLFHGWYNQIFVPMVLPKLFVRRKIKASGKETLKLLEKRNVIITFFKKKEMNYNLWFGSFIIRFFNECHYEYSTKKQNKKKKTWFVTSRFFILCCHNCL